MAKLDKASQKAYDPGGWQILQDLLKNWVAECVAFEVNDCNECASSMYKTHLMKSILLSSLILLGSISIIAIC